jgi:homoserine kinase type II
VPGRELGLFELLPETCAQVGEALARFHQATRAFHGGRRHPYRRAVLSTWLRALRGAPPPLRQVNDLLWDELRALQQPLGPPTTPGTLHGDPAPENFKFHHGRLSGFIDLEDASQGPLVHDLAHALYAWGWDREDLDPARCQALVAAYQLVRALTPAERRALPWQVRAVALRQAASCILRYHWRHGEEPPLVYREYTPHLRRLERLRALRPRRLREMCGVEGMSA